MSITEILEKSNWTKKTREMYDFKNVWSNDSKILFLDINGRSKAKVFYDWYLDSWRKGAG